jgi:hypothetical protein
MESTSTESSNIVSVPLICGEWVIIPSLQNEQ